MLSASMFQPIPRMTWLDDKHAAPLLPDDGYDETLDGYEEGLDEQLLDVGVSPELLARMSLATKEAAVLDMGPDAIAIEGTSTTWRDVFVAREAVLIRYGVSPPTLDSMSHAAKSLLAVDLIAKAAA